ncbi:hypothetical protein BURPS305_3300 [Burkholderia pseudomallei 305]|nr:hypothetical protein BURPS305_3300 [Burkholderia pseudomallei 305]
MLRRTPVLLGEALDFLESGDDALFAGGASVFLFGRGKLGQLCRQVVKIGVTHNAPLP